MIVELFAALCIKHFLLDFVFQTRFMYQNKGTYGYPGGIAHAAVHGFATSLIIGWINPFYGGTMGLLDAVLHYHIDYVKVKIIRCAKLLPTLHPSWFWLLGFDQLLHYLTYCFIIWWIT